MEPKKASESIKVKRKIVRTTIEVKKDHVNDSVSLDKNMGLEVNNEYLGFCD